MTEIRTAIFDLLHSAQERLLFFLSDSLSVTFMVSLGAFDLCEEIFQRVPRRLFLYVWILKRPREATQCVVCDPFAEMEVQSNRLQCPSARRSRMLTEGGAPFSQYRLTHYSNF